MSQAIATLENDPDVLWIRLRAALREGRIADAIEAQQRLADAGIQVHIDVLDRSGDEATPRQSIADQDGAREGRSDG